MAKLKTTTKIEGSLSLAEVASTPSTLDSYAQLYTKADNVLYCVMGDDSNKTLAFLDSNITGTAANLSGTPALPDGTTATTQSASDNSTKLATTAYADAAGAPTAPA